MLTIFLKLLLVHLIGDFVLQPRFWVIKRKENIFYLFLHIWIHILLLSWVFWPNWDIHWINIAFIAAAHLGIDSLKIWIERQYSLSSITLFAIDQGLHVAVLLAVIYHIYGIPIGLWDSLFSNQTFVYSIALVLTLVVSPICLRLFFMRWNADDKLLQHKEHQSLLDAGMLIGILERIMIILFIQLGFLSGIGFLLAAKSIFRFGDLSNAKDTKFTEDVMLGTLLSFAIAIAIGFALRMTINYIS